MATHSRTLAWRIQWPGEPGRLQSMGSQRVRCDWMTKTFTFLKIFGYIFIPKSFWYISFWYIFTFPFLLQAEGRAILYFLILQLKKNHTIMRNSNWYPTQYQEIGKNNEYRIKFLSSVTENHIYGLCLCKYSLPMRNSMNVLHPFNCLCTLEPEWFC